MSVLTANNYIKNTSEEIKGLSWTHLPTHQLDFLKKQNKKLMEQNEFLKKLTPPVKIALESPCGLEEDNKKLTKELKKCFALFATQEAQHAEAIVRLEKEVKDIKQLHSNMVKEMDDWKMKSVEVGLENDKLKEGHDLIYKSLREAEGVKDFMTSPEPESIADSVKDYVNGFHDMESDRDTMLEVCDGFDNIEECCGYVHDLKKDNETLSYQLDMTKQMDSNEVTKLKKEVDDLKMKIYCSPYMESEDEDED
jgi:hypothetical protein